MSTQHTPGPWAVTCDTQYKRGVLVRDKGGQGYVVAACDSIANTGAKYVNECLEANARLIAAAPDLLAAAQTALAALTPWRNYEEQEASIALQTAIAKAKGAQ